MGRGLPGSLGRDAIAAILKCAGSHAKPEKPQHGCQPSGVSRRLWQNRGFASQRREGRLPGDGELVV
jgi:hypothetical protein